MTGFRNLFEYQLVARAPVSARYVARNPAWEGELLEQLPHPFLVLRDIGVNLAVGAFQIAIGHNAGTAMAGADDIHHVQIALHNDAVQVDIDEIQARRRAPVSKQSRLDVLFLQRLLKERIIQKVNLPHRKIIRGAPPGIHLAKLVWG